MIERISPDNPLTERHAGMMAVMRNNVAIGPLHYDLTGIISCMGITWDRNGIPIRHMDNIRIIAVMPMPDLSGLEG